MPSTPRTPPSKLHLGRSLGAAAGPDCASWVAAFGTKSEFVCLDVGVEVVDSGRAGARRRRREVWLDLVASVVPDEDPELETLKHLGWR